MVLVLNILIILFATVASIVVVLAFMAIVSNWVLSLGRDSQRFLSKNSYLSTTFVVIFTHNITQMLYLSKNSYLRIFVNPGPGGRLKNLRKNGRSCVKPKNLTDKYSPLRLSLLVRGMSIVRAWAVLK